MLLIKMGDLVLGLMFLRSIGIFTEKKGLGVIVEK
jgi:hypothetical protein